MTAQGLDEFENLIELSLGNIGLKSLEGFPKLEQLHSLKLSDNHISGGLEHLNCLDNLQLLDLSGNKIATLDALKPLAKLKNLRSLDLFMCPVNNAPGYPGAVFELIENLEYLDKYDVNGNERRVLHLYYTPDVILS